MLAVTITGVIAASMALTSLAAGSTAATKVRVRMTAWNSNLVFQVTPNVVKAGQVTFVITNVSNPGNEVARFVLLKTDLAPDKLPVDKNGNASEKGQIGKALVLQPHKTGTLTINLKPGKYVVIDNFNYGSGQYPALKVTG